MNQRLPERTDRDMRLFDWGDVYMAAEVRRTKRLMSYGRAQFEQDWEEALALAVIMANPTSTADFAPMLDDCFMRIHAYMANHPDEFPFERHKDRMTFEQLDVALKGIKKGNSK